MLVVPVPPLRERRSDIPALADGFLKATCARFGVLTKRLSGDALDLLMAHQWRGNVRELRNAIERMVIAADGEMIRPEHLPAAIRGETPSTGSPSPEATTFQELRAEAERRIIIAALERHDWHITRTAQALGLADHASLLKIMRRLAVSRE